MVISQLFAPPRCAQIQHMALCWWSGGVKEAFTFYLHHLQLQAQIHTGVI